MNPIIITAIGVGGSTVIGSLLGYFIHNVSHKTNDCIIGFCAGIMLSASILGLLVPAFSMIPDWSSIWLPIVGVICGAIVLNALDYLTPHLHHITCIEQEQHHNNQHINRVLLFVMAIALHKFPEGLAAGVSVDDSMSQGINSVALAISLQNVPEGMVVISPLLLAGISHMRTFVIALAIGLLEVAGVVFGYYLGGLSQAALPFMLALSGGAMLYVVSDEMIPESHAHGFQKIATYALLAGFIMMLLIERINQ